MKRILYAGIFSVLMSSCATPKTTFVDYPVIVDGIKSIYTKDSEGNCYLKMPAAEGREWRFFNEGCDETGDSVALSFQEYFLLHQERKELDQKSRHFIDTLFLQADNYQKNKEKKRGFNDIPF
jgi:hypothetical protein